MGDPFARLQSRLFASKMSKRARLRVKEDLRVLVDQGVATFGDYGSAAAYRTTVCIPSSSRVHVRDLLEVCMQEADAVAGTREVWQSFIVDSIVSDDGYETKVIVHEGT